LLPLAVVVAILAAMHLLLAPSGRAQDKQETPRNGGDLIFLVPSEPPA
jgi:hypothetical protein